MAWSHKLMNYRLGWFGDCLRHYDRAKYSRMIVFSNYGFDKPMQNDIALVYYNDVAAQTLDRLWKSKDSTVSILDYSTEAAQF